MPLYDLFSHLNDSNSGEQSSGASARHSSSDESILAFALLNREIPSAARIEQERIEGISYPQYIAEFWTARQRQAASLHEISYRACFKPQLPRFFIHLFTRPGDTVYDPFAGRGTTAIEAGLLGRRVISNDVNPLSKILTFPRFFAPDIDRLAGRLSEIPIHKTARADIDLSVFYHPDTEAEIVSLREYLRKRQENEEEDALDAWIRMVATNRLSGHSPGFFSVYTLPPNQAVSPAQQRKINAKRNQTPGYRDTRKLILKKSRQLLSNLSAAQIGALKRAGESAIFLCEDARCTSQIPDGAVQLTVTSPPFLNVVQYAADNWLRCWFNGINAAEVAKKITMANSPESWSEVMAGVFAELFRLTRAGGWVAFEVGEVRNGQIRLEEYVVPVGVRAGFRCRGIVINQQQFTKTANIWGVQNNRKGTNSNRIVLFHKG